MDSFEMTDSNPWEVCSHESVSAICNWDDNIKRLEFLLASQVSGSYMCTERSLESEGNLINLVSWMTNGLSGVIENCVQGTVKRLQWSLMPGYSLDSIQQMFTDYLNKIQVLLGLLRPVSALLYSFIEKLDHLYLYLMINSLVVELQPPSVIKKNDNMNLKVRFLAGLQRSSNQTLSLPVVKIGVINKCQVMTQWNSGLMGEPRLSSIDQGHMMVDGVPVEVKARSYKSTDNIVAFENFSMVSVKRGPKVKGGSKKYQNDFSVDDDTAMTELFCLMYSTDLLVNGRFYEVRCWSNPFIFHTHTNQLPSAHKTMFWQNNFPQQNGIPLHAVDSVPWSRMRPALAQFFMTETQSKRMLTEFNLQSIGKKLFGSNNFIENTVVSRQQFFEEIAPPQLGFWDFFYGTIKLLQVTPKSDKIVRQIWDDGYMIGFIGGKQAEQLLLGQAKGTFLIRFSESAASGITISWVTCKLRWEHCLYKFTDLAKFNLAERILSNVNYSHVYYYSMCEHCFTVLNKESAFKVSDEAEQSPIKRNLQGPYVEPRLVEQLQLPSNSPGSSQEISSTSTCYVRPKLVEQMKRPSTSLQSYPEISSTVDNVSTTSHLNKPQMPSAFLGTTDLAILEGIIRGLQETDETMGCQTLK